MDIVILTIFPEFFESFLRTSLIAKAIKTGAVRFTISNIRDFAIDTHHKVDDEPYGGGAGMVMKPEPLYAATAFHKETFPHAPVLLLSPRGVPFVQQRAQQLSEQGALILVCGRYEGLDQRYIDLCVDEEISIGDFILMGGEVASLAVCEAVTRLIPGVLGNNESAQEESFSEHTQQRLEAPHYTRPPEFQGKKVPDVLLSGDHSAIKKWRLEESLVVTKMRRPDLLLKKR